MLLSTEMTPLPIEHRAQHYLSHILHSEGMPMIIGERFRAVRHAPLRLIVCTMAGSIPADGKRLLEIAQQSDSTVLQIEPSFETAVPLVANIYFHRDGVAQGHRNLSFFEGKCGCTTLIPGHEGPLCFEVSKRGIVAAPPPYRDFEERARGINAATYRIRHFLEEKR